MTKGRDPGQVVRGEATCPWDLNRVTQLISQAESLGFKRPPPRAGEKGVFFHSAPGPSADGRLE